jgi:acetylglutamate kinase
MTKHIEIFKIGGSALNSVRDMQGLISCLKPQVKTGKSVIVHGGGNTITQWLGRLGIEHAFINGQRITDEQTMHVVEMVLSGLVNKELVSVLNREGFNALGISGRDANLAVCGIKDEKFGRVGEIEKINPVLIFKILKEKILPVVSPVSNGSDGRAVNVNADNFASRISVALKAESLNIVTVTGGVLKEKELIRNITCDDIPGLIKNRTVSEGMIPKLESAVEAIKGGIKKVNMLNYRGEIGTCVV